MAFENGVLDLNFVAGEDLSSHQFRFVHQSGDNAVDLLDSGDEIAIGVLQNAPESGQTAVVRMIGVTKLVAGSGGLAVGDAVTPEYVGASDNGKGVATTTNGDAVNGVCVFAAGDEDDLASVLLAPSWYNTGT